MITPNWPAPAHVRACVTTRSGGVSLAPYDSFNLAHHVGDDLDAVLANRAHLMTLAGLPSEPAWITQVHGIDFLDADTPYDASTFPQADAALTRQQGKVVAVLTADCLPVLMTDRAGSVVLAIHAGWRGLADGILAQGVKQSRIAPEQLLAWIGPGIGPDAFEVQDDVRDAFLSLGTGLAEHFKPAPDQPQHWLADLYAIARWQLTNLGVGWVGGGDQCTYHQTEDYFSFRRDGVTGRMASLIWLV